MMKISFLHVIIAAIIAAFLVNTVQGELIIVPNSSFEDPEAAFVDPNIMNWQDSSKPWWYDESGGYLWNHLTGVFLNLPPGDPDHIDNCDANQAAWLFAVPDVELFQELTSTYDVGRHYRLTVGVIGGGGNMKDDVPIEIRLYYRDEKDNKVTIESTIYTYDSQAGSLKHFNDVHVSIPMVYAYLPWAGKNIGIQIISTLIFPDDLDPDTGRAGGFWDLDNVRLTAASPDFSNDCFVNLTDFSHMAMEWMSCEDTTTDQTGEGCVDFDDLMILTKFWLHNICE